MNDELYAQDYANILSSRGYGKFVIVRKLKEKHLDDEFIQQALAKLESENDNAKKAFDFKIRMLKNEKDPKKHQEKLYRFMLSRGFSSDIIRQLYAEYHKKL